MFIDDILNQKSPAYSSPPEASFFGQTTISVVAVWVAVRVAARQCAMHYHFGIYIITIRILGETIMSRLMHILMMYMLE